MDLEAYIGAKIDEAVDAYDGSTESVKENIETIDDALAVSEERQKWKEAIEDIKAEIHESGINALDGCNEGEEVKVALAYGTVTAIIDKHTKELMK